MSETTKQDLEVTPPDSWQSPRRQGFPVLLPSGNVARVRRTMDLLTLAKSGSIPNPLGSIVQKMIDEGRPTFGLGELEGDALTQAFDLIDTTVVNAMVEPRVALPPEKDEEEKVINPELWQAPPGMISIMDLSMEDRLFIVQVAHGGTTDLNSFRVQQAGVVQAVAPGKGTATKAKRVAPTKRTGGTSKRK